MAAAANDAELIEQLAGVFQFHLGATFEVALAVIRAERPNASNSEIVAPLSAGAGRFDLAAYMLASTPAQGVA